MDLAFALAQLQLQVLLDLPQHVLHFLRDIAPLILHSIPNFVQILLVASVTMSPSKLLMSQFSTLTLSKQVPAGYVELIVVCCFDLFRFVLCCLVLFLFQSEITSSVAYPLARSPPQRQAPGRGEA